MHCIFTLMVKTQPEEFFGFPIVARLTGKAHDCFVTLPFREGFSLKL